MRDSSNYFGHHHLEYRAAQTGAPVLVFANSLGTDFRIWDQVLALLPASWGCLRYDMRGHGLSALSPQQFTIDDLADDLTDLTAACGIGKFIGVGVSVGGLVMQRLAVRSTAMQGVVLMDTAARIGTDEMWSDRIQTVLDKGIPAISDAILQRWFCPKFISADPSFPMWDAMLTRTPARGYARLCEAIRAADFTTDLARIDMPVSVLVGAQDQSTPPKLVKAMAAQITNARFVQIEDAGHLPCIEQPAATAFEIEKLVQIATKS